MLELKDGEDSAAIYDAMTQLHRYWRAYEFGDAAVKTGGKPLQIDAFLIATQFSPNGHLFKNEREQGYRQTYSDSESGWNEGMRPQYEYARTESIPRIQWRYAWQEAEERQNQSREDIDTAIGVLLSDELDVDPEQNTMDDFLGESDQPYPKMLTYDGSQKASWKSI